MNLLRDPILNPLLLRSLVPYDLAIANPGSARFRAQRLSEALLHR
jgi:hypothetical protein